MKRGAWWLPDGSIRDLIVVVFSVSFAVGFLRGQISGEVFAPTVIAVVSAHFGLKHNQRSGGNG